jgi:diguanylate cyclase (GGDEF)-like protein
MGVTHIDRISAFLSNLRERFYFLRGGYRLALALPLAAALLTGIGWHFLLARIDNDRIALERHALREADILAKAFADQVSRTVESIDQTALHVRYAWEMSRGRLKLDDAKSKGLFPDSSTVFVAVINRNGFAVTATGPSPGDTYVGDQPYFAVQRASEVDSLYIDRPGAGRASRSRRDAVSFSRKIRRPDGGFDGIVLVSVPTGYFTSSYSEAVLGTHGLLGVVGRQRDFQITRIGSAASPVHDDTLLSVPDFSLVQRGSMLARGSEWFKDKRDRYVGWEIVEGAPMVAIAGLDEQQVLARYRANRDASLRIATLSTVLLAVFTLIATALSLRLAWRKHELETTRDAYRMATEGGNEGFYITRPITDRNRMIVDFKVVDCNHRAAELVGLRREELIGQRVSALYPAYLLGERMDMLRQAMDTGVYEGELEDRTEQGIRWVHLKAVRYGRDLAVSSRDISETKAHVAELERRSNEDVLTGLPNRHWVEHNLPKLVERASSDNKMLAVLFIDLDGFKSVNDTVGHAAGDEVLRNAARRLSEAVRPHDCVARLGGDEFVVLLEHLPHKSDAAHVAERILHAFLDDFRVAQGVHAIGASIGISVYPSDGNDAHTLLRNADIAMYSVKTAGKRNFRFYDERFYDALRARLEMEAELRHAIENGQFVMHYQPRIDMTTGATSSMEALVRWVHPTRGLIGPAEFIPLAEDTGLIINLGELVIDKVCAQLAEWGRRRRSLVPVSVNVSSRQFNESNVAHILSQALAKHQVPAQLVEVELTESSVMADSPEVASALNAIREMGIKLLIDDFGTGYSSLAQLQSRDFDVLKVDRAFTAKLVNTEEGNVFFNAIITMAHALGMRVVAEGVETMEQIEILKSLDCDEIQGFYISEPLPPSETQPVLRASRIPSVA